ncbi:MAG: hypothetical protein A2622_04080 [Bdellovibrionales bacterium RIFCSPHIGHO2_01_FULL_40_29]|nr:MAG: hypothetical protein A2622_04080 [Bdellovibrionales bacterium RIFCSPHIGHO2_01_FULL_40_29]OFZ34883.1 MAG: hypothetical protein A3D17_11295 [Bdellovibrionales bacterium RIFCSPHIGHO2_02_FULL_40_15]
MAKELLQLGWVEELLPKDHIRKRMFGGFSYYLDEKLILVMFESVGNKDYRGESYDFEIWNGCMFPVEREHHAVVLKKFPFLINHPVLPKWLYLMADHDDFDSNAESLVRELRRKNPLFGSYPKGRAQKSKKSERSFEKIDTRRPRMFGDVPAEEKLKNAQRLTDLKNIGPETERAMLKAGVKTLDQFVKMGWEKAMIRLCKVNPKNNHSLFAYALIGALQNKMWNQISEADKKQAREFMKSLRDKATLRSNKKSKKKG